MRDLDYDNLSDEDKAWMKSRNMPIPGEDDGAEVAQSVATPENTGSDSDSGDDESDNYEDWKLKTLQREAKARKLPTSGTKAELAERLREDDANE